MSRPRRYRECGESFDAGHCEPKPHRRYVRVQDSTGVPLRRCRANEVDDGLGKLPGRIHMAEVTAVFQDDEPGIRSFAASSCANSEAARRDPAIFTRLIQPTADRSDRHPGGGRYLFIGICLAEMPEHQC